MKPRATRSGRLKILRRGGDYIVSCSCQPAMVMTLHSSPLST